SQMDLRNSMLEYAPGTTQDVEVIRNGEHKNFKVKLQLHEEKPDAPKQMPGGRQGQPQFQFPKGLDGPEFFKDFPELQMPGNGNGQPRIRRAPATPNGNPNLGVGGTSISDDVRQQYSIPADVKGVVVGDVTPGSVA